MGSHAGAVPGLEHGLLSLITPVKTRRASHDHTPPGTAAAASGNRRPSCSSSSGAGEAEEGPSAREDDYTSRQSASSRHRQSASAGSTVFAAAEGFVGREEGSRPTGAGTTAERNPVPPEAGAGGPQHTGHGVKPVDETRLPPQPPPPPIDAGHAGEAIDGGSARATGAFVSPASPGTAASPKESPRRGSSLAELDGFWKDGLLLRNKSG